MTCEDQLMQWVAGVSIHNQDRDECCPDFSCCQPQLLATQDERNLFVSRPDVRDGMLMMFLGRALSKLKAKVYVAGDAETKTV